MQLAPGTWITPTVRLVRPLGAGGMSTVWVAADMKLQTQVAVKLLSLQLARDATARGRFEREGRVVSKIDSPHLVQIYDQGLLEDGIPYMVMEWLEGETLRDRLQQRHRMPPREALSVVSQVARALVKAHEVGVVHRDVKPGNIFLLRSEHGILVKLLDFGVAKVFERDEGDDFVTATNESLGTPAYMSPEQLRHASQVDLQADLWAMAVLAYRLLIGRLPFSAADFPALCMAICSSDYPPPSRFDYRWPPALDAWYARAFKLDPSHRFRSAPEASTSLSLALATLGDLQPKGVTVEEIEPTHRRWDDTFSEV